MESRRLVQLAVGLVVAGGIASSAWALDSCWNAEAGCGQLCAALRLGPYQSSSWSCMSEPPTFTCNCRFGSYSGSCGCGMCFLAGTLITMADGTTRPIETIQAGDRVLAFDEATGTMRDDTVRSVHPPGEVSDYLVVNDSLRLTPSHPVLSRGKWIEIGRLKIGDVMTAADGRDVPIVSISRVVDKVAVHNFEVNPYHTYVANGIIVHNKPKDKIQ